MGANCAKNGVGKVAELSAFLSAAHSRVPGGSDPKPGAQGSAIVNGQLQ